MQSGFEVNSAYVPTGDQPRAIEGLVSGLSSGARAQTLLGVTGSGKTFTMAETIEKVGRPALIIAHNKTLAAQLANEFAEFFPNNAVEYFVSYYDYYQPEAYVPRTDTFIEKDAQINKDIDRLRHSTDERAVHAAGRHSGGERLGYLREGLGPTPRAEARPDREEMGLAVTIGTNGVKL